MELDITFSCKCSAFLDEVVYCDGPDISAATDEESLREYWKTFICDGCGQEYDAHIVSRMSETDIFIPNIIDLTFDILDHFGQEEVTAEIESTQQLDIYRKVSTDVIALLRYQHHQEHKATLNNILFAQVVTAIEAYLASSFISTVVNSDLLIRRLVETDPELAKRQFSLKEIFTQWEDLKFLVARYLKDLIFHDLKKIKPMYFSVLDIDFGNIAWLFKAILIRHDCIHRNGFDKDGNQHQIESNEIIELVKQCTHLVSQIEEHLSARKEA
ncbi:hypothetical protein RA178_04960 [Shewanella oncorhynchi]|uniref:RiboL-PSP-HEPN domain-containing protein n=1 Tax=Shewanella oncorhynchi TaxID=2726434 RepID=A0AA50KF04_9GAMM|nr:hypothetical protein [Shewanella oncorhynchi]WMB73979.1 hypothetical protein RA178_04960 [Shewanella oncorhynchi]